MIRTVEEFNNDALDEYRKQARAWNGGPFPNIETYTFNDRNGMPKKRGFVLTERNSHRLFKTRGEAENARKSRAE